MNEYLFFSAYLKLFPPQWNLIVLLRKKHSVVRRMVALHIKYIKCDRPFLPWSINSPVSFVFYYSSKYLCTLKLPFYFTTHSRCRCDADVMYWHNFEMRKVLIYVDTLFEMDFVFLLLLLNLWMAKFQLSRVFNNGNSKNFDPKSLNNS